MSQHDFDITTTDANTGITVRAAVNAALQALASCNSGPTEPATPYAYMWWADTTSGYLKQRNAANTAWLTRFRLSDMMFDTLTVNTDALRVLANKNILIGNVSDSGLKVTMTGGLSNLSGGIVSDSFGTNAGVNASVKFKNHSGSDIGAIDALGNALFGVGSGTKHTFQKSAGSDGVFSVINSSATNPYGLFVDYTGVTGGGGNAFLVCADNASRFIVQGSGNCVNVNNSYGAISDEKLKENVIDARDYLDDLCRVRVVRYSFVADNSPAPTHLGVIAQELASVFPGMVEETKDSAERQARDGEGNLMFEKRPSGVLDSSGRPVMVDDETKPIMERYETGEVTKGVKYSVFVPMLIRTVQELKAKNDALEARVTALEAGVPV